MIIALKYDVLEVSTPTLSNRLQTGANIFRLIRNDLQPNFETFNITHFPSNPIYRCEFELHAASPYFELLT